MLPPFIIEQIRRREEEERYRREELERPRLELPVDLYHPETDVHSPRRDEQDVPERGVLILDLV
ncbi:MAG TPA: hypothetical protein VKY73_17180 [Polyangiaceae bacterium]|nr:hypothetical protein [Polyangiaceae bacterium]